MTSNIKSKILTLETETNLRKKKGKIASIHWYSLNPQKN